MSRKKIEALAQGLKTMYLTENPANIIENGVDVDGHIFY